MCKWAFEGWYSVQGLVCAQGLLRVQMSVQEGLVRVQVCVQGLVRMQVSIQGLVHVQGLAHGQGLVRV